MAVGLLVGVSEGVGVGVEGLLVWMGATVAVDEGVLVCVVVGVIVTASSETTIWTYTLAPKGVPFLFAKIQ